jgi:hypothetical protein
MELRSYVFNLMNGIHTHVDGSSINLSSLR